MRTFCYMKWEEQFLETKIFFIGDEYKKYQKLFYDMHAKTIEKCYDTLQVMLTKRLSLYDVRYSLRGWNPINIFKRIIIEQMIRVVNSKIDRFTKSEVRRVNFYFSYDARDALIGLGFIPTLVDNDGYMIYSLTQN